MDGELQQELETLKSSVCQIREKFLNKWTGETYKKLSNASKRQLADGVKCGQGKQW